MTATQAIWAITLAVTIYAGWIDWRGRRIPNWLTVPSLFLGIALHASIAGWRGALTSIEGVPAWR